MCYSNSSLHLRRAPLIRMIMLCFTVVIGASITLHASYADDDWSLYESKTFLFNVEMPPDPDEEIGQLRINDKINLFSSETTAFEDQRPFRNAIKSYVIKVAQTFGAGTSRQGRRDLMRQEIDLYKETYAPFGGTVIDESLSETPEKLTAKIILKYLDKELGEQSVQSKIILTKTSRFEQIFTGSERDLSSIKTRQFFDSFKFIDGKPVDIGSINEEWLRVESPSSIFSVKIPPIAEPYITAAPTVTQTERRDNVGITFSDPIFRQNMFYNVKGYRFDKQVSFKDAQRLIAEDFFVKHGRSATANIETRKSFVGDTPFIETFYTVKSPAKYPYINRARVRVLFLGNYAVAQELVGPRHLVETPFVNAFYDLIEFTPKKAFEEHLKSKAGFAGTPENSDL